MDTHSSKKFDLLLTKYVSIIERSLRLRMAKARDKEFVAKEIIDEIDVTIEFTTSNPSFEGMLKNFQLMYLRGDDLEEIIKHIIKVFGTDVQEIRPFKRIENDKAITVYISKEEKELKDFASDERKLVRFLIRHTAYTEIKKRLHDILILEVRQDVKPIESSYSIQWTGNKDNKNEFVQLVYALHEAGYLNKGKGEITKIIESLSEILQVGLGKNWQSNHSASIHKANKDYQPPVFEKIKQAYHLYMDELITAKKTNK